MGSWEGDRVHALGHDVERFQGLRKFRSESRGKESGKGNGDCFVDVSGLGLRVSGLGFSAVGLKVQNHFSGLGVDKNCQSLAGGMVDR